MPQAKKHAPTIAVSAATALVTAAAVTGGPAVAAGIFANNSDKVDGFHAVGAKADTAKRAGKLVATNKAGLLPDGIIARAPDADLLDGLDSTSFSPAQHNHDDSYVKKGSAVAVQVFAVRGDGSIRYQSDPATTLWKIGTGQYCISAPGAQEGAVGTLQNQGFESAGTIRVSMGIGGACNGVTGVNITVETFSGSMLADQRFALMYPVTLQ